jgi:hypothetical protein
MRFANTSSQPRAGLSTIRAVIFAAVVALTTETGCTSEADRQADLANGSDPLAALGATTESTRYTTAYWSQQADSNPALFARARAYCDAQWASGSGQRVNCAAVSAAAFEQSGRRPAPKRSRRDPRASGP